MGSGTDNSRARNPWSRLVETNRKARIGEPPDSNMADARTTDVNVTEELDAQGFVAFQANPGVGGPSDKEPRALLAHRVTDTDGASVIFVNTGPVSLPMRRMLIQTHFVGTTTLVLKQGILATVGPPGNFGDLVEDIVRPITIADEEPKRLAQYDSALGAYEFGPFFTGLIKIKVHGTMSIDSGAEVPIRWIVQKRASDGDSFFNLFDLAEPSYRSVTSPTEFNYESPWVQHFKNNDYRLQLFRSALPAADMILTAEKLTVEMSVEIEGP